MNDASTTIGSAEQELVITRLFDASRARVFAAWTDPAQMARWMGPRGFTATDIQNDFRPGSRWRLCLRADDGSRSLWQGGVCRECVPPERLAFTFAWDDEHGRPGHEYLVTIDFAEEAGRTRMTLRQSPFLSAEQRDGHRGGWNSTLDRFAELLAAS